MASELRVNTSTNRVGLGTITYTDTGPIISGITTGNNFKTGTTNVHSTGVELANINTGGGTATFGGGLTVTGAADLNGALDVDGQTDLDVLNVSDTATFSGNSIVSGNYFDIQDTKKLRLGTDGDLSLYHQGGANFIKNSSSQIIHIQTDASIRFNSTTGSENILIAEANGPVKLFYNNSNKIETTNTGAVVTGILTATGNVDIAPGTGQAHYQITQTNGNTVKFGIVSGSDIELSGSSNNSMIFKTNGNNERFKIQGDGLKEIKNGRLRITSTFIDFSGNISTPSTGAAIFRPASDTLAVSTNNLERLRIDSNGKLLIGTTRTQYANDYYDDITINNSGGSGAAGGTGITMISNSSSWGALQFGDESDDDCAYIKYDHNGNKFIFGIEDGSVRFWQTKAKTWFGTHYHGEGSRSSLFDICGANQDPTGVWTQMGLYSSDSQAANKGGSIGFGGQDGTTVRQQFAAIKGAKENGNSGDYAGYMAFYTRPAGAVSVERLRIKSDGRTSVNIDDARFGQGNSASGNKFYQNTPKLGVQGSIVIGNLSSTATDVRELAFYRRAGSTAGSAISTHHMGRIAWYGSSNDSSFPDMAWSIECNPNGNGWTAGSNRHGYLSFISGRNGQYMRLNSSGYLGVGHAGDPSTRLHVQGNSDGGAASATLTIEDSDDTAGSKEPILAFDGAGTRQARIMSSDQTSTGAGGLYFAVGSSNTTALQLTAQRYTKIHNDVRAWATVEYTNLRTHCRMHYAPGNAVSTYTLLRIRRHWWGWGNYKIRCKAIYYNSSLESTWYVNGHGSGGNNYSIAQETFGGDAMNNSWNCTVTLTASNNSPGSSGTWYADVQVNIPNYYYVTIWVEAWGSSYTTDPTTGVANSINTYCLM